MVVWFGGINPSHIQCNPTKFPSLTFSEQMRVVVHIVVYCSFDLFDILEVSMICNGTVGWL